VILVGLVDIFLVYFVLNFIFIVSVSYMIVAEGVSKNWKNETIPVLSLATVMTILLVLGLVYELAGYVGAFASMLLIAKNKINGRVLGKISESPALCVMYLIGLCALSFVMTYWKLGSVKVGIALGVVYFAYSVLALYSHIIRKEVGQKPSQM
jgi:hypothetical protein